MLIPIRRPLLALLRPRLPLLPPLLPLLRPIFPLLPPLLPLLPLLFVLRDLASLLFHQLWHVQQQPLHRVKLASWLQGRQGNYAMPPEYAPTDGSQNESAAGRSATRREFPETFGRPSGGNLHGGSGTQSNNNNNFGRKRRSCRNSTESRREVHSSSCDLD